MVEGIDRLKANFAKLGKGLLTAAQPAMLEGADKVVFTARALVPKRTGHLASTISHNGIEKTKNGNDMVVISAGDESTRVGASKEFQLARLVEFGTQKHAAEPYLRPAFRQHRRSIISNMRKAIGAEIKK